MISTKKNTLIGGEIILKLKIIINRKIEKIMKNENYKRTQKYQFKLNIISTEYNIVQQQTKKLIKIHFHFSNFPSFHDF